VNKKHSVSVDVDVEVDLNDFSDEELIEELKERGIQFKTADWLALADLADKAYVAVCYNDGPRFVKTARELVGEITGKVL
jgi:hypothetical protein